MFPASWEKVGQVGQVGQMRNHTTPPIHRLSQPLLGHEARHKSLCTG